MSVKEVSIESLRLDGGTQVREQLNEDVVAEYAARVQEGNDFPACIVFHDGSDHWLADGFHRVLSHKRAGREAILCDVRKGTKRDAILYACGANSNHGLRRTNADKRRAVNLLLSDEEWAKWSDRTVADKCAVSHEFVRSQRPSLSTVDSERTFTTKHGTTAKMNTANIGRRTKSVPDVIPCPHCGTVRPNDPGRCPFCKDEPQAVEADAQPIEQMPVDEQPEIDVPEIIIRPPFQPLEDACTTDDLNALVAAGKKFACIYADPPWKYGNQATRASTDNHYPTMSVDDIASLPIRELVADDAHLHLWVTNGFLFESKALMDAWGFEFRSTFVWCKPQMGIGNYWRNSHEILLTAIRGDAKRFNDRSLKSWAVFDRTAHSAKPEDVRGMIERASAGPRLELFGRRTAPGWTVWGNQISRTMFDVAEAI